MFAIPCSDRATRGRTSSAIVSSQRPRIAIAEIFAVFTKVSLTSFGGGLSGWMYREFVEVRGWFSESEFLTSLAIAQAMPGLNVVNLAIWLGFRLRGTLGAIAAFCAMVFPPLAVIIAISIAYDRWGHYLIVHRALAGVAAAALAVTLNMGSRVTIAASRDLVAGAIVAIIFFSVGVMRWPMVEIVVAVAPLSVAWAFFRDPER